MSRRFVLILVAVVVVFGGIMVLSRKKDKASTNSSNTSSTASNHTFGEGKKGVVLIEYGDYQCPACGQFYPIVKQVAEKYKSDITFQFRNFPLVQSHPNAMQAARTAEAASLQGKFWEMHDLLYEQQQNWQTSTSVSQIFADYAAQLGLNVEKFKQDVTSTPVADVIDADIKAAQAAGGTGTPTFVLDGKKIDNPRSLEDFNKKIDDAIAAKKQ
jgi:protein-disulfide isomerase